MEGRHRSHIGQSAISPKLSKAIVLNSKWMKLL